jgi:Asp/Glu/hydantoin racemase
MAGHAIGIIINERRDPLPPGNVNNATTFSFPVRYKLVKGSTFQRLAREVDPTLADSLISAAKELEEDGVRAISGGCGYFVNFQKELADAVNIPVFTSSLLQVPLIHRSLKRGKKVGIICAESTSLRKETLEKAGIDNSIPIAIAGMENQTEFRRWMLEKVGECDFGRLEREVIQVSQELVERNPEVGTILFECSDLPSFSKTVQEAVDLPVFDYITLINWVYHAVVQRTYVGFM